MEYYQDIEIQGDRYEEEQRILQEIHRRRNYQPI